MLILRSIPCPYALVATLGAGGMATVYLVRDETRGTLHALKVGHVATGPIRCRLLDEARLHARLEHPNVVAVSGLLDLGDGTPALLMEYVRGPSLARLLATRSLTIEEADALARPMLRGLAAAHDAGLVHRDIKPSNILIALEGVGLVPKVTDFGIAKELVAPLTARATLTGSLLGTPQYMSPEQLQDAKRVDARSDIFSMGAVLYEMVTGRPAFEAAGPSRVPARIQADELTPIRDLAPDVPDRIERAVTIALACDPEERWPTVGALLAAWVGDEAPRPDAAGAGGSGAWPGRRSASPVGPVWPDELVAQVRALQTPPVVEREPAHRATGGWLNTAAPAGMERAATAPRRGRRRWRFWAATALAILASLVVLAWRLLAHEAPSLGTTVGEPTFTRLTFNEVADQILGAALSPDGRKLVTIERQRVFIREALPGPAVPVRLPEGTSPTGSAAWCGDDVVALGLRGPGVDAAEREDVWWGSPPAGPWQLALAGAAVRACSWDGARLVAMDGDARLVTVDLPSGRSRAVADLAGGYVAQAAFSPDGAHIAYTWTHGEQSSVQLAASVGASTPRTLGDDVLPHGLAWSGDGHLLTLRVRDRELDDRWASLVAQRVAPNGEVGRARVLVPRMGPAAQTLTVSRAGDRLAFLTITRQRSVFAGKLDGGDVRRLTNDRAPAYANAWLDDQTLVYSATTDGHLDVLIHALDAPAPSVLFGGPADEYGATRVPGSRDWLFERRAVGGDEVELVWARPGGEEVLWSGPGADYLARSRTRCVAGPTCYFGVSDARGIAVSVITPTGLAPITHLPTETWRPIGWDVSPTGDRIAWSASRELRIRRLEGGGEEAITLEGALQEVVWGPDGDWILGTTLDVDEHPYAIVRVDVTDGAVSVVHPDVGWLSHLALAPAAARMAWTRTEYDIVVWLVDLRGEAAGTSRPW